jgi:hypothetical protein
MKRSNFLKEKGENQLHLYILFQKKKASAIQYHDLLMMCIKTDVPNVVTY